MYSHVAVGQFSNVMAELACGLLSNGGINTNMRSIQVCLMYCELYYVLYLNNQIFKADSTKAHIRHSSNFIFIAFYFTDVPCILCIVLNE